MNNTKGIQHPYTMADLSKTNFTFPSKDVALSQKCPNSLSPF